MTDQAPNVDTAPNAAEWISAISTAGALIAAAVAALIAWRVHVHNQTEKRAEQAGRVAGWIEWRRLDDAPGIAFDEFGFAGWRCVLSNSSALPVYDVLIIYWLLGGPRDINAGTDQVKLLPPGGRDVEIPDHVRREQDRRAETHPTMRVEIRFTDTAGRRWHRAHNGVLTDKGPWKPPPPDPETETEPAPTEDQKPGPE
jgi:hypothetical protein